MTETQNTQTQNKPETRIDEDGREYQVIKIEPPELCKYPGKTPEEQAFLDMYYAECLQHPFAHFLQHWTRNQNAYFELRPFDGRIHLGFIGVVDTGRGKGTGSQALKWLCAIADKTGVEIGLSVQAPAFGKRLNNRQLKSWYRRHGFLQSERSKRSYDLRRKPNPKQPFAEYLQRGFLKPETVTE